ncbi:unnamed protein product, partial [Discosporangium mesarthrocarpum]
GETGDGAGVGSMLGGEAVAGELSHDTPPNCPEHPQVSYSLGPGRGVEISENVSENLLGFFRESHAGVGHEAHRIMGGGRGAGQATSGPVITRAPGAMGVSACGDGARNLAPAQQEVSGPRVCDSGLGYGAVTGSGLVYGRETDSEHLQCPTTTAPME